MRSPRSGGNQARANRKFGNLNSSKLSTSAPQKQDLPRLRDEFSQATQGANEALHQRTMHLANLAVIDAKIKRIELDERATVRRRRFGQLKRKNSRYLDGSPRDLPGHEEILWKYSKPVERRRATIPKGLRIAIQQRADHERIIAARYGGQLPDDEAGMDDLRIAAQLTRRIGGDISKNFVAWTRQWARSCSETLAREIAAWACDQPYQFTSDVLGQRHGLTYAERQDLGITSIGSIDVDKAERERRRRQRSRAKEKQKRHDQGAIPRENSRERLRPWEDEGMSRATWYRRRRTTLAATAGEGLQPVEAQTLSEWELASSHGRIKTDFEQSATTDGEAETDLRPAFSEAEKADRVSVSTASRAAVDASSALSAQCAHAPSPCARSRSAQASSLELGLGKPKKQYHPSSEQLERAYEDWIDAQSEQERRRILKRLFRPTRKELRTRKWIARIKTEIADYERIERFEEECEREQRRSIISLIDAWRSLKPWTPRNGGRY